MQTLYPILMTCTLFRGFSAPELDTLLPALRAVRRDYPAGETLLHAGERSRSVGVVLAGRIEAAKAGRDGRPFIVSRIGPGGVYGDVLALGTQESPATVTAITPCRVLLLPAQRLLAPGSADPRLHGRLAANWVGTVSAKYFALDARLNLLLLRGLRRRLAAYLLEQAEKAGANHFTIPFGRADLAAWLGCERSALSREISALVREGLIQARRSAFMLINPAALRDILE